MEPQALRWVSSNNGATKVQQCGSGSTNYYLGGTEVFANNGDSITRTYENLPSHSMVSFSMRILLVDSWTISDRVSVLVGGYEVGFTNPLTYINSYGSYRCGNSSLADLEITSYGLIYHTASTLTIKVTNKRVSPTSNGTILFNNINLFFTSSVSTSLTATFSYPLTYISAYSYPYCWLATYYYSSTYGCQYCSSACEYCYGPYNYQCYKCASGYYYDGYACVPCYSTCRICHGTAYTQCDYCTGSYYLIDNQCVSCNAPFVKSSQYFGTCSYPCLSGEYLYADGSCYTTCDPRFIATTLYSKLVCNFPCSGTYTRYYDGVCMNLACPYPLQMARYGSYYICEYPCAAGLLLYANGSCLDPAGCVYPFVKHTYTDYHSWDACGSECAFGLYRYNNDSCHTDCPEPLIAKDINGILICDPPRCGPNQCGSCTSWNTCPDYYVCHVFIGGWCMFQYTYYLTVNQLRSVMNGVVFSVKVLPLMGIGEFNDDVLKSEIPALTKDTDYEVSVKRIATGSFEVKYTFLDEFEYTKLNGTMYYSPGTLGLEQSFRFPSITFISAEVQQAAATINATSQITFILFLIGIFGMVFGGGIASLWTSVPESQYTYYLIYLNVGYLHHTTKYLQSLSSYDFLVSDTTGPELDYTLKSTVPETFFNLSYSSDFYNNTDQVFLQLLFMIVGLFVGTFSLRFLRYPKDLAFIQKLLSRVLSIVKWNGLMRQFMTYILPFSTAAFVQIYAAVFGQVKQRLFSLMLAPATMVVVVWFLAKTRNLIAYIPNEKYERIFHHRLFGTLWENLGLGSIGKYYFWFGAIRNIVLAYVAVFFDFVPYIQILTLIGYQLGMVLLFFKTSKNLIGIELRRVFEDKVLNIITLVQELLLLVMKIMILAFYHKQGTAEDSTLILLGWMIILPGILSQVVQTGFSLLNQVRNRQKIWRKFRVLFHKLSFQKKKKRIKRVKTVKPQRNIDQRPLQQEALEADTQVTLPQ